LTNNILIRHKLEQACHFNSLSKVLFRAQNDQTARCSLAGDFAPKENKKSELKWQTCCGMMPTQFCWSSVKGLMLSELCFAV